jgi:four helix bundle protein
MNIVLEESDETLFWLELIAEMKWVNQEKIEPLVKESNELTAIFVTILKKVNSRINNK